MKKHLSPMTVFSIILGIVILIQFYQNITSKHYFIPEIITENPIIKTIPVNDNNESKELSLEQLLNLSEEFNIIYKTLFLAYMEQLISSDFESESEKENNKEYIQELKDALQELKKNLNIIDFLINEKLISNLQPKYNL